MCLILFAWDMHPKYKLVLAANRDEFYERPTAEAGYWETERDILAGRDLKAGGTWLGVNKNGKFAALTNYRDLSNINPGAVSRGELPVGFLKGNMTARAYLQKVAEERAVYNGFNLLVGDIRELYYYSNVENKIKKVAPGFYGLSNHLLNTDWPKVKEGRQELKKIIEDKDLNYLSLFKLLQNKQMANDDDLPETGLSPDWERALSAMFIDIDNYGTCSSTLLMTDRDGEVSFIEKSYNTPDNKETEKEYKFKIV